MIQFITKHFIHSWSATTLRVAGQFNHRISTVGKFQSVKSPPCRKFRDLLGSNIGKLGMLFLFSFLLLLTPLQANAGTWTSVGPYGGYIYDLAISPNYATDQTLFAGAWGGVFKSENGGGSWIAVSTGLSNISVSSLSISPNYASDQTIFAGTGGGIFKSTNGGASWIAVNNGLSNLYVQSLSISPNYASDQTIFAGTWGGGIFKSTTGGGSWIAVSTGLSNISVSSLSISPNYASDQTIFAGTGGGIFKSTNGGASWIAVNNGLGNLVVRSLSISPNYISDQTIFAGIYYSGVFKSTNGGASWIAVNNGLGNLVVGSLSISPNYASDQTIFAGTWGSSGIFKSTNGGASWIAVNNGLSNLYVQSLSISPNYASDQTIFIGTDGGGIFKSMNGGGSWSAVNTGLGYLSVYSLALSPNYASDQTIFAGTWGGGIFKSTNDGSSWSKVFSNQSVLSLSISPNYVSDQTIFAGTEGVGIFKSTNGGASWSAVNTGLSNLYVESLSISPTYTIDQTIFAGTQGGVFKSTNGGGSWSAVNTGLGNLYVKSLSISPNYASDQTIFAGTGGGGVYKSTNGGGSWSAVNTGLSYLFVVSLSISPDFASDQTIFAGPSVGGVFKSTNGGGSWSAVNTGLSNLYMKSFAISPNYASDQTIFAGTYGGVGGVFKSTNGGGSWSAVNAITGLSNMNVSSLSLSPNYPFGGALFAGISISSVWKYTDTVCSPSPEVCNRIDDDCDGLIDEGVENTYYRDADSDTYGNAFAITQACNQPLGYVSNNTDCDDSNISINPGAAEVCNGVDDNCNGQVDEGVQNTFYRDSDNDTYGNALVTTQSCTQPAGYVSNSADCNDSNALINPGAAEVCNGVDDNCNGQIDEGVQNTYYRDADGDGYGNLNQAAQACAQLSGYVSDSTDCNDNVAGVNPAASDVICDGVDNNCNGMPDDGYVPPSTTCGVGVCGTTGQLVCVNGQIQDTCTAGQPQTEGPVGGPSCNDNMDNDCDGLTDTSDSDCINTSPGQNVVVQPIDETTGTAPVNITFSNVTDNGITSLITSGVGQPPPSGFRIGNPPVYYDISTTAAYNGPIQVCLSYNETQFAMERNLKLFHQESGVWVDITDPGYPDTINNIICGTTTSLSPFAIFEVINQPPVAEAGADLSLACLELTCPVILDGSGSTDPNSTPGTNDDIVSYEWFKNYGETGEVLLAAGRTISYDLPLGDYQITLVVTDRAGAQGQDNILVRVNPAQLSLLEITKAEVEWEKAGEKPNRVKIHGRVAMPVGKDYYQVNPSGKATLGISTASNALNQNVVFQVKGEYGSKWEYKADPTGIGISKYEIDWQGAKFDYNREIRLKSNHLGYNSTTLEIDRKDITEAIVITVSDITIHIDPTGAVSAVPETTKVDVDDDGEIEVELPFALAMNTVFSVSHGTTSYPVKVGDYYSAAVGKFELMGRFDPSGLNGTSRPATLDFGITFGDQKFPGMFQIFERDWAQLKNVEWKYKK